MISHVVRVGLTGSGISNQCQDFFQNVDILDQKNRKLMIKKKICRINHYLEYNFFLQESRYSGTTLLSMVSRTWTGFADRVRWGTGRSTMNEWYQTTPPTLWSPQIHSMKHLLLDIAGSPNIWIRKFFLNLYVILKVYFTQKILKHTVK